ncbi:phosphoglycerate mutase family [Fusarium beomiforme]|uniref:Phosphoglycerate mutase family n=1 Tax=Fusarium beomiforme TaxID=44412 RepID=A0A9P5A8G5_9HYPO|nr:phosphoglycerate mutase family [Fusarium beomiforme]
MGWFDDNNTQVVNEYQTYNEYSDRPEHHEAKLSHEVIGGAAAYEAAKAYEEHVARNGQSDNHAQAKEILAGFVGAFVDREFETKGLDFFDKEKARHHGERRAEQIVEQQY